MDKQELKELEQNDLADFLINFRAWWDKHGTKTLIVILIIVASMVGYRYLTTRATIAEQAAWSDYHIAVANEDPGQLLAVAQTHGDRPELAAIARVNAANLLVRQVTFGDLTDQANQLSADPSADTEKLKQAEQVFKDVIATTPSSDTAPSLAVINAHFGLAALYERDKAMDKAEEEYKAIIAKAGPYKFLAERAQIMMDNLDRVARDVVFAPTPMPATEDILPLTPEDSDSSDTSEPDGTPSLLERPADDAASSESPADDSPDAAETSEASGEAAEGSGEASDAPATQPAE